MPKTTAATKKIAPSRKTAKAKAPARPKVAAATADGKTYQALKAQIASLQEQAEALRAQEIDSALANVKEAIALYGFTAADLGLSTRESNDRNDPSNGRGRRGDFAVRFEDGAGNEWNGRGPRPD
ncbi:MAG: H-NS histone family protein, partial [Variovorax sp.]